MVDIMTQLAGLAGASTRQKLGLAVLSGAVLALGQPPLGWVFLSLLGLLGGFVIVQCCQSVRQAGWVGWGFGTGYFAASLFWIIEPFLVDVARHGWMAPFALLGMAGGLALFWALASGVAHVLAGSWAHRVGSGFGGPLALALCLTMAEMLRSYILTGFPWGLVGYLWVDTPVAQIGALVGPHGLTGITFLMAGLFTCAVQCGLAWRWGLAAASSLALLLGLGTVLDRPAAALANPLTGPVVRLIQPNAQQHQKWDPEMIPVFLQRQLDLTGAQPETGRQPDLVVWPETAIPYLLEDAGPVFQAINQAAKGSPVVLGAQRRDDGGYFNSLVVLDGQGNASQIYDKHRLVPFGEYIPGGQLIARFGIGGLAARAGQGYLSGPGARLLEIPGVGRALPLICYEAIFPHAMTDADGRPDVLLQITNDAWFGDISGPYQHLAQARMRAIEQGLPFVRAANTGISAVIDPRGDIVASIPLGVAGYLDALLPPPLEPTIYSKTGDIPVFLLLALFGLGLGFQRVRNSN